MQADLQPKGSTSTTNGKESGLSYRNIFRWQLMVGAFSLLVLVGCFAIAGYNIYQVAATKGELLKLVSIIDASEFVVTVTKYVHQVLIPLTLLPPVSIIVFGIGGIARTHRGCITLFTFFLFMFAAIILGVGIAIYTSEQQYLKLFSLPKPADYGLIQDVTDKYDHAHLTWLCCGKLSPSDFHLSACANTNATCDVDMLPMLRVPLSCCVNITRCEREDYIYDPLVASSLINNKGCKGVIENAVLSRYRLISISLIILGVLMLITTLSACCLHHSIVLTKERTLLYDMGITKTKGGYKARFKNDSDHSSEEMHPMEKLLTKESSNLAARSRPSISRSVDMNRRYSSHSKQSRHSYKQKISIPISAILDPDTEISETSPTPFDRLVVVPIQELSEHRHRVRTISLKNPHKSFKTRSSGSLRRKSSRDTRGSVENLYSDRRKKSISDADVNNSNSSEESWERLTEYTYYTNRDDVRRAPSYPLRRRRLRRRLRAPSGVRSQPVRRGIRSRGRIRRGVRRPAYRL